MELEEIRNAYDREQSGANITRYFYVLSGGNAVNFLHGASVGAFVLLVQAEILAAVSLLANREARDGPPRTSHRYPRIDCGALARSSL